MSSFLRQSVELKLKLKPSLHDTTGSQTGWTTGCIV